MDEQKDKTKLPTTEEEYQEWVKTSDTFEGASYRMRLAFKELIEAIKGVFRKTKE